MALKVIDPEATLTFIPECEKESDNPTTFYIALSDMRDKMSFMALYDIDPITRKAELKVKDEEWIDFLCMRIRRLENIENGSGLISVSDPAEIKKALIGFEKNPYMIGVELFQFLFDSSGLAEEQRKN